MAPMLIGLGDMLKGLLGPKNPLSEDADVADSAYKLSRGEMCVANCIPPANVVSLSHAT